MERADLCVVKFRKGDKLYVFMGAKTEAAAWLRVEESKLEPNGDGMTFSDGRRVFLEARPIEHAGCSGSAAFAWDKSGNRVKTAIVRVEMLPDGAMSRRVLRTVFRKLEG